MKKRKMYVVVKHGFLQREKFVKFSIFFKNETHLIFESETERNKFVTKFRFKWIAKKVCSFMNFANNDLLTQYEIREIEV